MYVRRARSQNVVLVVTLSHEGNARQLGDIFVACCVRSILRKTRSAHVQNSI